MGSRAGADATLPALETLQAGPIIDSAHAPPKVTAAPEAVRLVELERRALPQPPLKQVGPWVAIKERDCTASWASAPAFGGGFLDMGMVAWLTHLSRSGYGCCMRGMLHTLSIGVARLCSHKRPSAQLLDRGALPAVHSSKQVKCQHAQVASNAGLFHSAGSCRSKLHGMQR